MQIIDLSICARNLHLQFVQTNNTWLEKSVQKVFNEEMPKLYVGI